MPVERPLHALYQQQVSQNHARKQREISRGRRNETKVGCERRERQCDAGDDHGQGGRHQCRGWPAFQRIAACADDENAQDLRSQRLDERTP